MKNSWTNSFEYLRKKLDVFLSNDLKFENIIDFFLMKYFSGDVTLSVEPSSHVVVNQTITLQCLFKSGQLGVIFNFPKSISCIIVFGSCAGDCRNALSSGCPNNQTYILNVTVLSSWHNTTFSCEPPFGGMRSEITLNVTGMMCTCLIVSEPKTLYVG